MTGFVCIRVVVSDDHDLFRRGVVEMLTVPGDIEVVGEAATHEGAVAAVLKERPDVVLLDLDMDIFLATSRHGRGLGAEALRVLARHLFEERGHYRLTTDPAADNAAAIRAYEKVGFRRVVVMRRYERCPDGDWHDGLLMDMLREEFRP